MTIVLLLLGCAREDPAVVPGTAPIVPYDPLELVDPFIGTGGVFAQVTGMTPAASLPFGLTLVGPDTQRVEIDRPEGTLVIEAPGASATSRYVQQARIGGDTLSRAVLTHQELLSATLVLDMGPTPGGWLP